MFISKEESKEKAVFDGGSVCHHFFFCRRAGLVGMIGRRGQLVTRESIGLGPRLPPPPPPLFFFQSHRCEEREGKRASEDQRTEAEERSYGRFFLFFFFVCVCVCVSLPHL